MNRLGSNGTRNKLATEVALVFFLGAGCSPAPRGPWATTSAGESSSASGASRLPEFELDDLNGNSVALSDHLGKEVILLDFWATFCEPCLVAMPHLNDLYEKYKDRGFVVLGVSVDDADSIERVRAEVKRLGVKFPILLDQNLEVLGLYNPASSAPYSILIDKQGNVLKKKEGFTSADVPDLEGAIEGALGE